MTLEVQRAAAGTGETLGPSRRVGRPRNTEIETLAIRAAAELLEEGEEVTVSKVVARSGVSRAAIYRRWPSITFLIAAALDLGRTSYPVISVDDDLREAITRSFLPHEPLSGYPMERFYQRIKLIVANPELQHAYWESHVARRRAPLEASMRQAVADGRLRADLDVAAAVDALAGIAYYQILVRGADLKAPETRKRMEAATEVLWRGIRADSEPDSSV